MTRRTLIAALVALLLLVAGIVQYRRMSAQANAAAAADCGDKPKPKDEFTMAAPCDGADKGGVAASKPVPAASATPK